VRLVGYVQAVAGDSFFAQVQGNLGGIKGIVALLVLGEKHQYSPIDVAHLGKAPYPVSHKIVTAMGTDCVFDSDELFNA
jgi:hypothetical protein